jgi:copper chaperone CopZ
VPKEQRTAHNAHVVKEALLSVPGVKDVRVQPGTGNVVIEHDERADIVENIGEAIREVAPELLAVLTAQTAGAGIGLSGLAAIGALLGKVLVDDEAKKEGDVDGQGESTSESVKRLIPWAFAGAGLMALLEGEALLAGVPPLALFYWAFDTHWKFKEERIVAAIQEEELATAAAREGAPRIASSKK